MHIRPRTLTAVLVAVLTLASTALATPAQASGNGIVTWKSGADVARGLESHGITCRQDGSIPKATWGYGADGKHTTALAMVQCDGFTVVLVKDLRRAHAIEKATCTSATAEVWDQMAKSVGLTGRNFYVLSSAEDHHFPADAQPAVFQKALGGIIETDAQYLTRMFGCHRP